MNRFIKRKQSLHGERVFSPKNLSIMVEDCNVTRIRKLSKRREKDTRNDERRREQKMQLQEKHLRVFADVSYSESGVDVFNRRHLFLTSLPCLSLLPALKRLLFFREQRTVDSNE